MLRIYSGPVDTTRITLSEAKAIANNIFFDKGNNIVWLSNIYRHNETTEKYEILEFLIKGFLRIYPDFLKPSSKIYPFVKEILENDDLYMFDMLVRYGYPIKGSTKNFLFLSKSPIDIAINYGYADIFDYLLNKGVKVTYEKILLAIRKNRYDIFVRLLQENIDLTIGKYIIYDCIQEWENVNILPFLEKLIAIGFDVNIPPEYNGLAALVPVFENPNMGYSVLEMLIRAGVDVNSYNYNDKNGRTLLTELIQRHYITNTGLSIDLLLANGAKIKITDYHSNNIKLLYRNHQDIYHKYSKISA